MHNIQFSIPCWLAAKGIIRIKPFKMPRPEAEIYQNQHYLGYSI